METNLAIKTYRQGNGIYAQCNNGTYSTGWDDDWSDEHNHINAAQRLADEMGVTNTLYSGPYNEDWLHVSS